VLSPDGSLLREDRWLALTPEQRRRFPPLGPELVIELASASDEGPRGITALRRKMALFQANGARLGWLLLPHEREVEIWRGDQQGMAKRLENASRLDGGELAKGLSLELEEIWEVGADVAVASLPEVSIPRPECPDQRVNREESRAVISEAQMHLLHPR
jgi:Uma2 family endonuclease